MPQSKTSGGKPTPKKPRSKAQRKTEVKAEEVEGGQEEMEVTTRGARAFALDVMNELFIFESTAPSPQQIYCLSRKRTPTARKHQSVLLLMFVLRTRLRILRGSYDQYV